MTKTTENAKQKLDENLASLYMTMQATGADIKVHGDEIHEQKKAEFIGQYYDTIRGIMADAEQRQADAASILERVDRPQFNWLTDEELSRADTLLGIVQDDLKALDNRPHDIVEYIADAVASNDKALQFLVLRKVSAIWDAADSEGAFNPLVINDYLQGIDGLRQSVTPSHLLAEEATAKETFYAAAQEYTQAEYLLPDYRQDLAVRLGLDVDSLPEELPTIEEILAPAGD